MPALLPAAVVAVAAGPLLLAPCLEVPIPCPAEQLLEGILELIRGLAKEGVAGSSISQVILKRDEVDYRLLAKHHLLYKAVAVADSSYNHLTKVGKVDRLRA